MNGTSLLKYHFFIHELSLSKSMNMSELHELAHMYLTYLKIKPLRGYGHE
jgi:hypothetical protein